MELLAEGATAGAAYFIAPEGAPRWWPKTKAAFMDRDRWDVLSPLLDRALELSALDRESWLDELRAQSPLWGLALLK